MHEKPIIEGHAGDDGLYSYTGSIDEVKSDVNDKSKFTKDAVQHSKEIIAGTLFDGLMTRLTPLTIDVNPIAETYTLTLKDSGFKANPVNAMIETLKTLKAALKLLRGDLSYDNVAKARTLLSGIVAEKGNE